MSNVHSFPSPLVQININVGEKVFPVSIPRAETFRIKEIINEHEYAIPELQNTEKNISVVDVGANCGVYTLYAKLAYPNSVVHCFEPAPNSLSLLEKNVGNLENVHIHQFGLSIRAQTIPMHVHPANTGQNTLKTTDAPDGATIPVSVAHAGDAIDALRLSRIDILKIDTEGCEVEILLALGNRIENIGYLLIEYHSESDRRKIDDLLKDFTLIGSKAVVPETGVVKYRNNNLQIS